ncbi:hypothetical protein [Streptomyces apocyni]|uniref:hypothetical protein n=1 Tax=Streptomyces apocyni TaxID=2654677 RepID=UPI0012EA295D|nr:hypothetical protein [Streptomyces apocyni]
MATQCKLLTNIAQTWTPIRFDQVLRNDGGMYQGTGDVADPESALIQPSADGDFIWHRFVHWAPIQVDEHDSRERQFLSQFCRDPYTNPDSTGSTDADHTAGKQFHLASWAFYGRDHQPVAIRVWHDHDQPVDIIHAQFTAQTWDY